MSGPDLCCPQNGLPPSMPALVLPWLEWDLSLLQQGPRQERGWRDALQPGTRGLLSWAPSAHTLKSSRVLRGPSFLP